MSTTLRITHGNNGCHTRGYFNCHNSLEERRAESERIRKKYPDKIPVIVERDLFTTDVPCLTKNKFLFDADFALAQFGYVIRKKIHLGPDQALFLFVNNTLPPCSALMSDIYAANADEDGFLYVVYSGENAFG